MSKEKDPKKDIELPTGESVAAKKARATLADPELQKALAELRAVTPQGEPMFGFRLKVKDARDEIPQATRIELEEGAAIVADTDAAAAYVEGVEPSVAPSPRMPTGKIRFSSAVAATDTRRQPTQRSIRRGGSGAPLPVLDDEDAPENESAQQEDAVSPAVLDREASVRIATRLAPTGRFQREPANRLLPVVLVSAFVFAVVVVVGLALRAPAPETPQTASSAMSATQQVASSPATAGLMSVRPQEAIATTATSMPVEIPASVAPIRVLAPTTTASGTSSPTRSSAPAKATAEPTVTPSASSVPTTAPPPATVPPAAPKPLIYD